VSRALFAKTCLSKFHHDTKLWASQNIFAGLSNIGFSKYGHILSRQNPMVAAPGAGLAGKPMGAQA
jgi:hypothetical protein